MKMVMINTRLVTLKPKIGLMSKVSNLSPFRKKATDLVKRRSRQFKRFILLLKKY